MPHLHRIDEGEAAEFGVRQAHGVFVVVGVQSHQALEHDEKLPVTLGIVRGQIPTDKIAFTDVDAEIDYVIRTNENITVETGRELGGNLTADDLAAFDAVFLAFGLSEGASMLGERPEGVMSANAFLARAKEEGETTGLIRLNVDGETEQFLGATVFGITGDEVIAVLSNYMATGASYRIMQQALPVHPTVAELLPTILAGLKPLAAT